MKTVSIRQQQCPQSPESLGLLVLTPSPWAQHKAAEKQVPIHLCVKLMNNNHMLRSLCRCRMTRMKIMLPLPSGTFWLVEVALKLFVSGGKSERESGAAVLGLTQDSVSGSKCAIYTHHKPHPTCRPPTL